MCGIIGYTGHRPALPLLMEGLKRMEYRGYDSSGVAFVEKQQIQVVRAEGKLVNLENKLAETPEPVAKTGIGHTRWGTHGVASERNAHPHLSNDGKLSIIHNGIIENYQELKNSLKAKGYVFHSDTDTEVLANLIESEWSRIPNLMEAFASALRQARGAYAVALISADEPDTVLVARLSAPLLLGIGQEEMFAASDMTTFLDHTRKVVFMDDGELAKLTPTGFEVFSIANLEPIRKAVHPISWDIQTAQKDGFRHFMLKEILEQPEVIANCLAGRLRHEDSSKGEGVLLPEIDELPFPGRLHIVACGTSFHAGLWARDLFEDWAGLPVSLDIASEFRYRRPMLGPNDLLLAISQSGETADTLAAMRMAKKSGCHTLGLCNVVGSSIAREADSVIYTHAGPEISVASTKALCSQMVLLLLLALYFAERADSKRTLPPSSDEVETASLPLYDGQTIPKILAGLRELPARLEACLPEMRLTAQRLARKYGNAKDFLFLGRGLSYAMALEGSLKLKEISYIHAEGCAAGEMKHGYIALIEPDFPTFAIALDDGLFSKTASNIAEIQARRGKVIALVNPGAQLDVDHQWEIPAAWGPLGSFFALPALQLFSYKMTDYLGNDPDQPRNLAKCVTVE